MPMIDTPGGTTLFYRDWGTGWPVLFCSGMGPVKHPAAAPGNRCIREGVWRAPCRPVS
jgi:hypothetical protein